MPHRHVALLVRTAFAESTSFEREKMKLPIGVVLSILVILLPFSPADGGIVVDPGFCSARCGARCALASVKDRCLFYCGICCRDCGCVPPGTYGNKDQCPCYRDKLTANRKKPKCP